MSWNNNDVNINVLLGKTIVKIDRGTEELGFTTSDGEIYRMYHEQDCCEGVSIDDINGDLNDLLNSPILMAEEVISNENPSDYKPDMYQDSFTWTFYKLATIKGYVTIRWYGESNGYYSESVSFVKVN